MNTKPSARDVTSREAVLAAIAEFDGIGREAFLQKYGFGKSSKYFVAWNGGKYDSKAVLGAAHAKQFPEAAALKYDNFGGGEETVRVLEGLGFSVEEERGDGLDQKATAFLRDDFDLFARYEGGRPFGELSTADKEHYRSIRERLKALALLAARNSLTKTPLRSHVSTLNPNGRTASDMWCCVYPDTVPNKSYGLQVALILSRDGMEFCFCLGAGTSQVSDSGERLKFSEALLDAKRRLAKVPGTTVGIVSEQIPGDWQFRRQWRLPPGTQDFSDLSEWIKHASSANGAGASISKNLDVETAVALGDEVTSQFCDCLSIFSPLMDAVYDAPSTSAGSNEKPSIATRTPPENRTWVFQGNPTYYDVDAAIHSLNELSWLVNQHADEIKVGDSVYLWRSGPNSGIVALAIVTEGPSEFEEYPEETKFNRDTEKFTGVKLRVRLRLERTFDPPVPKSRLVSTPALSRMRIIVAPQGTNFAVTDDEAIALLTLVSREEPQVETAIRALPYSIDDILADGSFLERTEIALMLDRLRTKKNVVLQGPPGTGKTWLAKRLAYALIGERDESKIRAVQFHPNLSYEDFVRGWRPTAEGKLVIADGVFMEAITSAHKNSDSKFVVVVEEINRGNPAQIFGELLTLLESTKRNRDDALQLCYPDPDGHRRPVYIPENLFLIGTMNIADRSLALVDLALRRRFAFVTLEPRLGTQWRTWVVNERNVDSGLVSDIERRITELNESIASDPRLGKQFRIGHSYVTPSSRLIDGGTREWFKQIAETEIGPLLDEYWFDAAAESEKARETLLQGW